MKMNQATLKTTKKKKIYNSAPARVISKKSQTEQNKSDSDNVDKSGPKRGRPKKNQPNNEEEEDGAKNKSKKKKKKHQKEEDQIKINQTMKKKKLKSQHQKEEN